MARANLILEESDYVEWYSELGPLFAGIPRLREYYYLLSDLELNRYPDTLRKGEDPILISGEELSTTLEQIEVQFIWGVLSAFERIPTSLPVEAPYAEGNTAFWEGQPTPQAQGASFEIVCWDSSLTLFIGVDQWLASWLRKLYPDIRDLRNGG